MGKPTQCEHLSIHIVFILGEFNFYLKSTHFLHIAGSESCTNLPACTYTSCLSKLPVSVRGPQTQLAGPSPTQTSSCAAWTVHHPDLLHPLSLQAVCLINLFRLGVRRHNWLDQVQHRPAPVRHGQSTTLTCRLIL